MIKKFRGLFVSSFKMRLLVNIVLSYVITFLIYAALSMLLDAIHIFPFLTEFRYVITFVLSLGVFLVIFLDLMNITLKYIGDLSETIQKVTEGDYDVQAEVKYDDELGMLAANINALAKTLKDKEMESEILKENERLAYEAERNAENQKNELITNVAHDLRTPLTTIVGYLDLIKNNNNLSSEEVHNYAVVAYDKSIRLKTMMDELFEYTKLDSPDYVVNMTTINISELILQMSDEFYPDFQEHHLTPIISIPDPQLYIKADGQLMARVFDNLISNAIKYGEDGGEIKIEVLSDEDNVTIKVQNDGTIDKEDLPYIFNKFYRSDSARSTSTGSNGLGLAIAKNIVTNIHKGNIFATSHNNKTTFIVTLKRITV